jgi:hypothetical protein
MMPRSLILVVALAASAQAQPFPSNPDPLAAWAELPTRVSLTPTGAWLPAPAKSGEHFSVYDDSGPRLQVMRYFEGARLLVYVERDTLRHMTIEGVFLTATATRATPKDRFRAVGMMLHPETELDVGGPDTAGLTKVRVRNTGPRTEVVGFIPTSAIGTTARWKALDGEPAWKPDAKTPPAFTLLSAPRGKPFVTVEGTSGSLVMVLERKSGFALVRLVIGAVGWIATSKLAKATRQDLDELAEGVEGGEIGGVFGGGVALPTLADHTPLFDAIDGVYLGESTADFRASPAVTKGAWKRFDLRSELGPISVWTKAALTDTSVRPPSPPGLRSAP